MSLFSKIATVKPPRLIHQWVDAAEAEAHHLEAKAEDLGAESIGYAELAGFRYPVKAYHFAVSPTLMRGSRLDEAGLRDLAKRGFKGVVNLCKEYDDSDKVRAAGLIPLHLPILDNTAPPLEMMKAFLDFANDPRHQPTYVHCEAGKGRTGCAVACYRMAIQGWTDAQAIVDGQKFGLQLESQITWLSHTFYGELEEGKLAPYPLRRLAAPPPAAAPVAQPSPPHSDVIRSGSVIAPPKKSNYVADMDAEKKWFARLEEKKIPDLQPGDLLFYKLFDDANLIVKGQSIFTGAGKGSKYSIHCQIYLGEGKVLSAEAQGLISNDVWPDCIIYRANDPARAASAADVARFLVTKKIVYSTFHIFEQPLHDTGYGPVAKGRAEQIHRRELPSLSMMCSESAAYCFQDNPADPTIPLDARRLGPIHVEDYVNSHPERFTFIGRIREAKGGASSSASEEQQALDAIKAEAKVDAEEAAHKVANLGHQAKAKLKHLL